VQVGARGDGMSRVKGPLRTSMSSSYVRNLGQNSARADHQHKRPHPRQTRANSAPTISASRLVLESSEKWSGSNAFPIDTSCTCTCSMEGPKISAMSG
jgi:hypothetical protein